MARYHIHPETGNPYPCRATKGRCPFGSAKEHYATAGEAMAAYEASLSAEALVVHQKRYEQAPATAQALASSLERPEPLPKWAEELGAEEAAVFGKNTVKLLDILEDTPVGPVAVVFQEHSPRRQDVHVQLESGMNIARIAYHSLEDGKLQGYLNIKYADAGAAKRSWGDDEWTFLRYQERFDGRARGLTTLDGRSVFEGVTAEADILALKKTIWAKSFAAAERVPEGFDRSLLTWGSVSSLKAEHAPEGEKLERELAVVKNLGADEFYAFQQDHAQPTIDYSQLERPLRGQGMGISLYIYAARKLAERGLTLRGSGIQSPEAERMWLRMEKDSSIPVASMAKRWTLNGETFTCFVLDFTPERSGTAAVETQAKAYEKAQKAKQKARD
jgi:hypothetical protein